MNKDQMRAFMVRHTLTPKKLSDLLGVTPMAVDHWLRGKRSVNLTVTRLCNMFDKYPQLMKEF